ncbi:MAG: hypothetical protein WAV11_02905 [Minisyncoccia bacterium]
MNQDNKSCCEIIDKSQNKGILSGIVYGLIPHSFCLAFIFFAVIGATTATAFLKNFLLIPNLFVFLVIISLVLATISSIIYLKKTDCLCLSGTKKKWRYLVVMYFLTVSVNLGMFFWVIPSLTNISFASGSGQTASNYSQTMSINVEIPCSGHASLIIDEIKKNFPASVQSIKFKLPGTFIIEYNPIEVTPGKITSLEIFETYKATLN